MTGVGREASPQRVAELGVNPEEEVAMEGQGRCHRQRSCPGKGLGWTRSLAGSGVRSDCGARAETHEAGPRGSGGRT